MHESFPNYAGIQDLGTNFGADFIPEFTYLGLSFHNEYLHVYIKVGLIHEFLADFSQNCL